MQPSIGSRLVLRLRPTFSSILAADKAFDTDSLRGDISIAVRDTNHDSMTLSIDHLGLISTGFLLPQGDTGLVSILGFSDELGALSRNIDSWSIDLPINASVLYRAVERRRPFRKVDDRYIPEFEIFRGRISGTLVQHIEDVFTFNSGFLSLTYRSGGLGWIKEFELPLTGLGIALLKPPAENAAQFRLRVQPIGFKSNPLDPSPTGISAVRTQLQSAADVWRGCGIEIEPQPFQVLLDRARKESQDPLFIRGNKDPEPFTLEIYFVENELADGGGSAISCGSALATIVVSDKSTDKPNLIAHEIGHILNGIHPTDKLNPGEWLGDQNSVLEPFGGPATPSPISGSNCVHARSAVLAVIS